jgi:ribosome-associated protein
MAPGDDPDDFDERPSKSARKREHQVLQELAEELLELPEPRFRKLELGERARDELKRGRAMAPGGSRNRQVRLIAQLLVEEDTEALRAGPRELQQRHAADTALHHGAERLRDALLREGIGALEALAPEPAQRERAARLLQDAATLSDGVRARTAGRELYRLARELLAKRP